MKQVKHFFTLIELLVVICIIAILASLLLPALQNARESANTAACINNLGQISKAVAMYETSFDDYIPALAGWEFDVAIANGFNISHGDTNGLLKTTLGQTFLCPADANASNGKCSYGYNQMDEVFHPGNAGKIGSSVSSSSSGRTSTGSTSNNNRTLSGCKLSNIKAPSTLIMIGEQVNGNTIGSGAAVDPYNQKVAIYKRDSTHKGSSNMYVDGHVANTIPEKTIPTKAASAYSAVRGATSAYQTNYATANTLAWGDWTNCAKRKKGDSCDGNSCLTIQK